MTGNQPHPAYLAFMQVVDQFLLTATGLSHLDMGDCDVWDFIDTEGPDDYVDVTAAQEAAEHILEWNDHPNPSCVWN